MHDDLPLGTTFLIAHLATTAPDWFTANAGTVLVVGGSVTVAIITGIFALWAKHHTPRQPVPIQDVWSENRSLRADLIGMEERFRALDVNYEKAVDIVAVLWRYIQRIQAAWGHAHMPALTSAERRTIAPLITDVDTATGTIPVTPA